MGQQMDLNFQLFETAMLFITVIVVAFFLQVDKMLKAKSSFIVQRNPKIYN